MRRADLAAPGDLLDQRRHVPGRGRRLRRHPGGGPGGDGDDRGQERPRPVELVGLIGAFIALLITDLVSDDLTIEGFGTWVAATVIVWLGMVLANLLLARWLFRKITGRDE